VYGAFNAGLRVRFFFGAAAFFVVAVLAAAFTVAFLAVVAFFVVFLAAFLVAFFFAIFFFSLNPLRHSSTCGLFVYASLAHTL
jgi:hypothetical protein